MSRIAFNVVSLPSDEISEYVISLNEKLFRRYDPRIILQKEDCPPHISLLMGAIEETDITQVGNVLRNVAEEFSSFELKIKEMSLEDLPAKDGILKIAGFELAKSERLQKLHEEILDNLKPFMSYDVNKNQMYAPSEIDEKDTPWMFPYINNFSKNSSLRNFNPHITIGDGEIDQPTNLPINFRTSRIALYRLGNYCTCRKMLTEIELK